VLSGGLWDLAVGDHSQLYLSGGQINYLTVDDYATAVLSGGLINKLENDSQGGYASVEVICRSYSYNTTTKLLMGVWENYSPFSIQLVDLSGYATTYSILDFTIIPEPMTLILLGLGGMIARRNRRN
jgi:hypothetical protein